MILVEVNKLPRRFGAQWLFVGMSQSLPMHIRKGSIRDLRILPEIGVSSPPKIPLKLPAQIQLDDPFQTAPQAKVKKSNSFFDTNSSAASSDLEHLLERGESERMSYNISQKVSLNHYGQQTVLRKQLIEPNDVVMQSKREASWIESARETSFGSSSLLQEQKPSSNSLDHRDVQGAKMRSSDGLNQRYSPRKVVLKQSRKPDSVIQESSGSKSNSQNPEGIIIHSSRPISASGSDRNKLNPKSRVVVIPDVSKNEASEKENEGVETKSEINSQEMESNKKDTRSKKLDPIALKPPMRKKSTIGPRLAPDTVFDREAVYAESRRRVKELTEHLRVGVKLRAQSPNKNLKRKKERSDMPSKSMSELDLFNRLNARMGSNDALQKHSKQLKNAFSAFLVPEDSEMTSGDIGYSEDITQLMGETKLEYGEDRSAHDLDPIKVAGIQRINRDHSVSLSLDAIEYQAPTSLQDLSTPSTSKRRESYDRLMSKIKIVPQTLVPTGKRMASSILHLSSAFYVSSTL